MNCTNGFVPGPGGAPIASTRLEKLSRMTRSGSSFERGVRRLGGKDPAVFLPEFLQCAKHYSLPDSMHGVKVKVEIMQRVKGGRGDLAGLKKMAEIRARKVRARVARARFVGRPRVFGKLGIFDIQTSGAREELSVARVA